jgi:hypothetical protein
VPIPSAPAGAVSPSTAVIALLRQLHDEFRMLVSRCDEATLNAVPCPGANSIATIITHVVGSEAETLRSIAGVPAERDRDAEFRRGTQSVESVLQLLDEADELVAALGPALTTSHLDAPIALPTLPASDTRPGITWLIGNLGHAREHLGHASLTKQLLDAARPNRGARR